MFASRKMSFVLLKSTVSEAFLSQTQTSTQVLKAFLAVVILIDLKAFEISVYTYCTMFKVG